MKAEKTYTFVKETHRDRYWKTRKEELILIKDEITGGIRSDLGKPVNNCLLCESNERGLLFKKDGFNFWRCMRCNFIYADPQIEEEILKNLYKGNSSFDIWVDVLLSEPNLKSDKEKYSLGLEKLGLPKGKKRLLDVGSSVGHFLSLAKGAGWAAVGLEVNERAANHAREIYGAKVFPQMLHELEFEEGSFQVCTLWGVIEHFKKPRSAMEQISKLLEPGGSLLIFCPNVNGALCRILREEATNFDGISHTGYFSPETFTYLAENCGFRVIEISTHKASVDTILNYLNYDDPYLGDIKKENPFREIMGNIMIENVERALNAMNLGSKMMALAEKL